MTLKGSIIAIISILSTVLYAQTLPISHMPRVGDTFLFAVDTSLYTPKPLTNGLFDFSDLETNDSMQMMYKVNDASSAIPLANLKMVIDTNETTASYFKTTTNEMYVLSVGNITSQIPLPNVPSLRGTMKYWTLPFTTSTNVTTSDTIQFSIPSSMIPPDFNVDSLLKALIPGLPTGATITLDSISVRIVLQLNLYANGSGKIKTPLDNNLDVIKIVRKLQFSPQIIANGKATLGFFTLPINYDVTSLLLDQFPIGANDLIQHAYVSPTYRQDIVNATVDSNGNYTTVNYRYKTKNGTATSSTVQINREDVDFEINERMLTVHNLKPHTVYELKCYGIDGRELSKNKLSSQNNTVSMPQEVSTVYVRLEGSNRTWTKKFQLLK